MSFSNPIVGSGGQLVRQQIKSEDYTPGVSGWVVTRIGDAEFNNLIARGSIAIGPDNGFQIVIKPVSNAGVIQVYTHAATEGVPGRIQGFASNVGAANEWLGLAMESPRHPVGAADDSVFITLNSQNADATSQANVHLDYRDGTTGNSFLLMSLDKNNIQVTTNLQIDSTITKPRAIMLASASVAGLARNTNQRIQLDSSMLDTDGGFDPVNHKYVFPRTGAWLVCYSIAMDSFSSITQPAYAETWFDINVSGGRYGRTSAPLAAANQLASNSASQIVKVNSGDSLDIWSRFNNGAVGSTYTQVAGNYYPMLSVEYQG